MRVMPDTRKPVYKPIIALVILILLGLPAGRADAHTNTIGFSDITVKAATVQYDLYLDPKEVSQWMDARSSGVFVIDPSAAPLKEGEVRWAEEDLHTLVAENLTVSDGVKPAEASLGKVTIEERNGMPAAHLPLTYAFPEKVQKLHISYRFFYDDMDALHQNIAKIQTETGEVETVFHQTNQTASYVLNAGGGESLQTSVTVPNWLATFADYVWLGMEHIWTGYDHLLFVLALILLKLPIRKYLIILTAFTVGHSITIALASLGIVSLSPSIVEPLIALSIAYVAIENLWLKRIEWRWMVALGFGLIHGFGFAEILKETLGDSYTLPLLSFNLGVELGQIAVLAVVLPLLYYAGRAKWYRKAAYGLSMVITLVGLYWFAERVWFS
ncbi:HupE/UreJ family protein [Paenibacillus nanensis]|uniref:HupE/UreJ family protein n=1 Tax=Paenibacillus nanensis TaxID=393251 RepID=A0A3A1URI9_9BACL|nr:HupE/UreJ family protein [Paenibacillus nanensis]RIX51169.1 HupE/UreJ family protein [Paenibacillus nanensis]